jgi:hypothetical protein
MVIIFSLTYFIPIKVLMTNPFMSRLTISILLFSTLLFTACSSNEIGSSKDVNPETVWFDYQVWGEEGNNDMTVLLQFRFAGENGTTLVLDAPSKVELDGELINGDRSKMTGAFYEIIKPVKDFTGNHNISFTDVNGKQYKEEFSFQPIKLITEIPKEVKRDDLVFDLDGLDPQDYVRVVLNDTSFVSEGINRLDTVKNGRVLISKKDLETVVNGPVNLELYKENEKPVKNGTKKGGRLSISYGLKREFELRE